MSETPTLYEVNTKEYAMAQSFTLYLEHIAKVSDLQQRLGIKRSEIVRRAIDLLYERVNAIEAKETSDASTQA